MSDMMLTDPLIGRQPQLDRLTGWVEGLAGGRGRAVLIEGEPGIGKSSLARSAAARAEAAGCQILWGVCDELSSAFPLLPLLEAIDAHEHGADPRRGAIVSTLRAGSTPGTAIDRAAEAVEQILALVDELCAVAPVLLVVDDLQWADAATVLTWSRLARSVGQLQLLLVGVTRPVPQRRDIAALRRIVDPSGRLRLQGLSEPDVVRLVTALAGGRPGPGLLRLSEGATGNPLYLTELVDALARGGRLLVDNGCIDVTGGPAPDSLSAAIADRLEFLSAPARGALRAAALLGVDFSVSELAVVSGKALAELLPVLDEATVAGVLRDDETALAFRHPLIRTALYEGIPHVVRAAWHRDVGRALANHCAPVERVARQLLPALDGAEPGPGGADHWAVRWLVDAAQQLVGQAPQAAVPLLRWAVTGTPAGSVEHDVLACRLADALYRMGDPTGAAQVTTRALTHVTDPDLLVDLHWTLTQCRVMEGRCEETLADLERALVTPGIIPRHRARLLILVARVHRNLGRVDDAARFAAEALAEARAADDRWAKGWALSVLTMVHGMRGDVVTALPLFDEALAVADGEPALADMRLLLQINQATALGDLDRHDEAIAAAQQVRRSADRDGNVLRLSQAESLLADLLFEFGHWEEALAEVDLVDMLPGVSRNPVAECLHHGIAAIIKLHCGDDGARHLAAAEPYVAQIGNRVIYPLALSRSLDRERSNAPAEALAALTDALARSAEAPAETVAVLADAVRLAIAQGDRTAAEAAATRAGALADGSTAPYPWATRLHCRGLLDHDPAQLLRAAEVYLTAGRPLPRAQALEAAGVALADHGDTASARASFNDAFSVYAGLGASWDLARMQARFRAYGIRRGPFARHRRADHGWESLTPTEMKIVLLVARGMSNPQIAAHLFLSRRTVQCHVSHILTKLHAHSRMDIAREAAIREAAANG